MLLRTGTKPKTYGLFLNELFHLIFSDGGWPRVTETVKSRSTAKVETTVTVRTNSLPQLAENTHSECHHVSPVVEKEPS